MPLITYIPKVFKPDQQRVINHANQFLHSYASQGYLPTLRQLYYRFVAADLIENKQSEYKRLGDIINKARLAGQVDWNHLTDMTRSLASWRHWENPADIIADMHKRYLRDLWSDQDTHVEVWIEKDALANVVERACSERRVPYLSCRGYTSQSEMWVAGQRMLKHARAGKKCIILHLGDHDPSGIDMTRDIEDRLLMFTGGHLASDYGHSLTQEEFERDFVEIKRIALNYDQIQEYDPPPNPAKLTDTRAQGYIARHGYDSWELDALEPSVLDALIREHIDIYVDEDRWDALAAEEDEERAQLQAVSDRWAEVVEVIS